jgi:hypothetical protein
MRGYTLIVPDIHRKLNGDNGLIVKCLEVIRIQMPQILFRAAAGIEYDLISVGSPHGPPYPAIGIHCPTESDLVTLPDLTQIDEIINQWVEKTGLNQLREEALAVDYIDWTQLTTTGTFPTRTERNKKCM